MMQSTQSNSIKILNLKTEERKLSYKTTLLHSHLFFPFNYIVLSWILGTAMCNLVVIMPNDMLVQ